MKAKKYTLNNFNLWMMFGIAWFLPQLIIGFLPEGYSIILIPILIAFGMIICFSDILDGYLIEEKKK